MPVGPRWFVLGQVKNRAGMISLPFLALQVGGCLRLAHGLLPMSAECGCLGQSPGPPEKRDNDDEDQHGGEREVNPRLSLAPRRILGKMTRVFSHHGWHG